MVNDEYFLLEFPLRLESERFKMEKWKFNNMEFFLEWWSPVSICSGKNSKSEKVCLKLMGLLSHLWSENIFKLVGDRLGGYS